jgi:hypothetical protein
MGLKGLIYVKLKRLDLLRVPSSLSTHDMRNYFMWIAQTFNEITAKTPKCMPISQNELRNSYFGKKEQNKELFIRNSMKKGTLSWKKELFHERRNKRRNSPKTHLWESTTKSSAPPPFASRLTAKQQASKQSQQQQQQQQQITITLQAAGISSPPPSTAKQSCQPHPKSAISVAARCRFHYSGSRGPAPMSLRRQRKPCLSS